METGGTTAGITGHQNLKTESWVSDALDRLIAREGITDGVTSLARGADQLFAERLLAAELVYRVVIPCARYEDAFDDAISRDSYRRLLGQAAEVETLPFGEPSEAAFFAAGRRVVEKAEILLAVWDGAPAKGLGGTGDVVAFAKSRGAKVIHIDCERHAIHEL